MSRRGWRVGTGGVLLACTWTASPGSAQEPVPSPHLALVVGVFAYDLEGEGTTGMLGLRLELPLLRYLGVETGLHYARYQAETTGTGGALTRKDVPLLMGDVQLQGRYPLDRVEPYLGLGVGSALDLREDRVEEEFISLTYTASAGVRVRLSGPFQALGEVRLRGIGNATREVTELVAGAALAF